MKNKKFKSIFIILALIVLPFGCTDLEVPIVSELTPENYPAKSEDFVVIGGPIYSNLFGNTWFRWFWMVQELSADGCILTANGGNWFDGGRYYQLEMHTWNSENGAIVNAWNWCFNGISAANRILALYELIPESDAKTAAVSEIRTMRAFYYFILMDLFGDVPIIRQFGQEVTVRDSRTDVFAFVTEELEESIPYLTEVKDISTYARVNKWMGHALAAKAYLNAEIFAGQNKYADVVRHSDAIIAAANSTGDIALDADYMKMFSYDNGPQVKDILFSIPYDRFLATGNQYHRFFLSRHLRAVYDFNFNPSGAVKAWPEYYDLFNDPTDERNNMWLDGPLYDLNGDSVMVTTTNVGLDKRYSGPEPNAEVRWHVEYTREIEFRNVDIVDTGDDHVGWCVGFRANKFTPAVTSTNNMDNDWPVFRYADVLLMKAEAIIKGASGTMGQTPLSLINQVRARAKATPFTSVTMQDLQDERARELAYEGWRRQDLIRWGKFNDAWGIKPVTAATKRIYPVPYNEMILNPQWTQNPGY